MDVKRPLNWLKKLTKRKLIALFLLLTLIFIARSYFTKKGSKFNETSEVKRGDVFEELTLSGKIDTEEKASLSFQNGGLISWVDVKEGDKVNKNQAVASLDSRQVNKLLQKNLNNYIKIRWDFEQLREDHKDEILTDKLRRIFDKSQADLNNSVLDVEIEDLAIKLSTISSPISGVVTRVVNPFAGINVAPFQTQFEIINLNTMYFDVSADQTEVTQLKAGLKTKITLDSFPDKSFAGEVVSISIVPRPDESSTVYKIKVKIESKDKEMTLRVGMTGDAKFSLIESKNTLFVPGNFIKLDAKGKYLVVGAKKQKAYIETGLEGEEKTEIKSGVDLGDIIYR